MDMKITVSSTSQSEELLGDILELEPGSHVLINHKLPKRQKVSQSKIAWSDVLAVHGKKGEKGIVYRKVTSLPLFDTTGNFTSDKSGCIKIKTTNGVEITVNPATAGVVGMVDKLDDEAEAEPTAATKPAKGGKKAPKKETKDTKETKKGGKKK